MSSQFDGNSLRAARENAELTREQLATAVTRTAQTIEAWENGRINPRPDTVRAIARALGVTSRDLTKPETRRRERPGL